MIRNGFKNWILGAVFFGSHGIGIQLAGAATIIDQESLLHSISGAPSANGPHREIKVCTPVTDGQDSPCRRYSVSTPYTRELSSEEMWNEFFAQCAQGRNLNLAAGATQLLAGLPFLAGVGFLKAAALSAGASQILPEASYPDQDPQVLEAVRKYFEFILEEQESNIFLPQQTLKILEKVLRTCAKDIAAYQSTSHRRRCMQGCHSGQ